MAARIYQSQPNLAFVLQQKHKNRDFGGYFSNFRCRKAPNFAAKCCLNLPLECKTNAGKSLSRVIQDPPQSFYDAVSSELNRVSEDRDAAFARFNLSLGSPEASLHRRIAELKETECQLAVEDVLNTIISYKFSEIRVPRVPSLSKCLYNGRLEILPSKDWELESIYSHEVLQMVREHLSIALGWKVGSGVTANWSTTKIQRQHISQVYSASIIFGYLLKSASQRLLLEQNLPSTYQNKPFGTPLPERESYRSTNVVLGDMTIPRSTALNQVTRRPEMEEANLRHYLSSFDMLAMENCAKLKSEEAVELVNKHCSALFGDGNEIERNEMILTSMSSLKRLVLEAVAFGWFLWDAEDCVDRVYKLKDRQSNQGTGSNDKYFL